MTRATWCCFATVLIGCGGALPPEQDGDAMTADAARPADLSSPPDGDHARDGGNGSDALFVVGCAGGLGSVGATFRGVDVYCEASSATEFYQCDELANRFVRDALDHPALDNVVTDYASSMCATAAKLASYSVWGPGFNATTGHAPVAGDLLVWNGSPGHVAVATSMTQSAVAFVQQNAGTPTGTVTWSDSFFGSDSGDSPECWIHAEAATPTPFPAGSDCGCFDGDGDYCGLAIVDHEAWYACTANFDAATPAYDTLYTCANGVFTKKQACPLCITPNLQPATGACQ